MALSSHPMANKKFSDKMSNLVRRLLLCCDRDIDDINSKRTLHISGPTNFRREDISIPGLTEVQQNFIREKAIADVNTMWDSLQPLKSSPSGTFAERPSPPSYEESNTPRSTIKSNGQSRLDRVRAHSRKISGCLSRPLGYCPLEPEHSQYETRALMGGYVDAISPYKLSTESFSVTGSEGEKYGEKGIKF